MGEAGFEAEMVGLRKMIGQFANIPTEEIVGTRIPFLMEGGEEQFAMMQNHGFQYDCTQATQNYGYMDADRGLFPYTLDYKSVQDCPVGACPKCSYPGIWMQPMIDLEDNRFGGNPFYPNDGLPCSMLDACIGFDTNTADEIKKFLERNFNRVYQGNRAPWGLYMHAAWFQGEEQQFHYDGYKMFVEYLSTLDDVWIVPVRDGIAYAKEPVNITELTTQGKNSVLGCAEYEDQFYARDCGRRPLNCKFSDVNDDDHHNAERYMKICPNTLDNNIQACPDVYPWLGNPCGGNSPCLD